MLPLMTVKEVLISPGGGVPAFILHKGIIRPQIHGHGRAADRTTWHQFGRHFAVLLFGHHLFNNGFVTMRDWTFENDNGRNPQTELARRYAEHWENMRTDNIGCLFWGGVGTGKSYLAGCIANALMEKEIPVHMTNFALRAGRRTTSSNHRAGARGNQKILTGVILWDFPS